MKIKKFNENNSNEPFNQSDESDVDFIEQYPNLQNFRDALSQILINQFEEDLNAQDYEALDELLQKLIEDDNNRDLLMGYLSDDNLKSLKSGKFETRW